MRALVSGAGKRQSATPRERDEPPCSLHLRRGPQRRCLDDAQRMPAAVGPSSRRAEEVGGSCKSAGPLRGRQQAVSPPWPASLASSRRFGRAGVQISIFGPKTKNQHDSGGTGPSCAGSSRREQQTSSEQPAANASASARCSTVPAARPARAACRVASRRTSSRAVAWSGGLRAAPLRPARKPHVAPDSPGATQQCLRSARAAPPPHRATISVQASTTGRLMSPHGRTEALFQPSSPISTPATITARPPRPAAAASAAR